ncbi:hypothetical protein NM688_g2731 [Phlebia brevispora]|uniref:Uncharacterized protein n=1 Tax=Phlebia brevispora TaxID=194682 RepID=A0ACC1T7Z7_9APHY|nr:hypothetical protein NM688_g2731 [Phlebia brevispora]
MSDSNRVLASLVERLDSNTIKERQDAVTQIDRLLRPTVISTLKSHDWQLLFDGIFNAFGKERKAAGIHGSNTRVKTSSPAQARKRMGDLSQFTRNLVSRSKQYLQNFIRPLSDRIYANIRFSGELLDNDVLLNFLKTFEELMSYDPNLTRLENKSWVEYVDVCFNIVLEDPLKTRLQDELEEEMADMSMGAGGDSPMEESMFDDEDSMVVEGESSLSKKRHHTQISQKTQPSTSSQSVPAYGKWSNTTTPRAASREQLQAMKLLRILLTSPTAPLISSAYLFHPYAILNRLQRFLTMRFGSSMLADYLEALSSVLSHFTLNNRDAVVQFSRAAWPNLVRLWGVREQSTKEHLAIVLKMLFPYYTLEDGSEDLPLDASVVDGVADLWRALEPLENRRGTDGLLLDSLRLQLRSSADEYSAPFSAETFQHGNHFDEKQALAWFILELQADCAERLFQYTERVHPMGVPLDKRKKAENPITSILHGISQQSSVNIRIYYLQLLLFFVDRHWDVLYSELQSRIVQTLLQFLSHDNASIQSWCFMCFAAIAQASARRGSGGSMPSLPSSSADKGPWDGIWAHAMRYSNVPAVCRAACHVAHILLCHAKSSLSPQRMIGEIEAFAKDLSIQGPSFPYDSVCALMVLCVRIARQDVRLYRMALEEKILTWLTESWRPGSNSRKKLPLHTIEDILRLLRNICGSDQSADLVCGTQLPDTPIVSAIIEEHATSVIRDWQLYARLPVSTKTAPEGNDYAYRDAHRTSQRGQTNEPLVPPHDRERRVSAFLQKTLDEAVNSWKSPEDAFSHFTAEMVRTVLDLSVIALAFEASLSLNGTQSNRRVIQAACRILTFVTPQMTDARWTITERAMIVSAFEPFVFGEFHESDISPWGTLLPAEEGSGIRTEVLRALTRDLRTDREQLTAARRALQRVIFQSSDVQETVAKMSATMRDCLRLLTGQPRMDRVNQVDNDDLVVRIAEQPGGSALQRGTSMFTRSSVIRRLVDIVISSLAAFPVLQSASGESTRDRELLNIVAGKDIDAFLLLAPAYLRNVREGMLIMNSHSLEVILNVCANATCAHAYQTNLNFHLLTVQVLRSTMNVWVPQSIEGTAAGKSARELCGWVYRMYGRGTSSWRFRDCFVQLLEEFVAADPGQMAWPGSFNGTPSTPPSKLLPEMGGDSDVRVRLRAAVSNARILRLASDLGESSRKLYTAVRTQLSTYIDRYEEILTRLVCLGNIMVVSSKVRRGAYWHLVETSIHGARYTAHIETILSGVASRLGLPTLAALFEVYAGQIASSIRLANTDFLRMPPHLLGYKDKRQLAEAAFPEFAPRNLLELGSDPESVAHGRRLFKNHCCILQKSTEQGLRECFPEVIGHTIVSFFDQNPQMDEDSTERLWQIIQTRIQETGVSNEGVLAYLRQEAVGVVIAIVRTLNDQDGSLSGSVYRALQDDSPVAAEAFRVLATYRALHPLPTHQPNLPSAPVTTILRALEWFHGRIPVHDDAAVTYHVIHSLFAALERNPLVNEQLRMLNVICLWVAYHHDQFTDKNLTGTVLLRTLVRASANLLSQFDLIRSAQSILHWGLSRLRQDIGLAELLVRIACAAYDWTTSLEEDFARTGGDLLEWAEEQISSLSNNPQFSSSVRQVMLAWPRDLPDTFEGVAEEPTGEDISGILANKEISSNKFRLVRQLRKLAYDGLYKKADFAKSDFWRLKEYMPSARHLSANDIDSFAQLLLQQNGPIDGLECECKSSYSILDLHVREEEEALKDRSDLTIAPQRVIMASLLTILSSASTSRVYSAFVTLRSLLHGPSPGGLRPWSPPHDSELHLLKAYAKPLPSRPYVDLQTLLNVEAHLEAAEDFQQWIRWFTKALADNLAATKPFYGSLSYILDTDADFAESIFPLLVYVLLRLVPSKEIAAHKETLSSYFSHVLSSERSSPSSRRAIINTVVHLRYFNPSKANAATPLAYDLWLPVDFVLLSKNAILCGAYTTALLFLELAAEHGQGNHDSQSVVEQVLYDIYDHIDEQDGFYGIQTQNLHQFLLKSFHHENQWDKAFRFHGAATEASPIATSAEAQGLLQAIHAFGFDRLAMTALQGSSGIDEQLNTGSMIYSLGWRTETWDLPEQSQVRNPSASLYLALRATNRERDPRVIDDIVERAIVDQMQSLHLLGNEDLAGIRTVNQSLMCLEQVRIWRRQEMQQNIRSRSIQRVYEKLFCRLDDGMEFNDVEAIMSTRIALVRSIRRQEQREQLGDLLTPFTEELVDLEARALLDLSRAARKANRRQIALNAVVCAQKLHTASLELDVTHEYANVLWMMDESMPAMLFLRNASSSLETNMETDVPEDLRRKALTYALLGTWASEACMEKPTYINSKYFEPAAKIMEDLHNLKDLPRKSIPTSVYHDYAIFAERQYHIITKAPDLLRWKMLVDRKSQEVKALQAQLDSLPKRSDEHNKVEFVFNRSKKILEEDTKQYQAYSKARDAFLERAIEMHSRSLAASDEFDESAIRLCSLWFANFEYMEDGFQHKVHRALNRVASHKFVFLAHQLSARLAKPEAGTEDASHVIWGLMCRMCREHPFHCLYSVYCLKSDILRSGQQVVPHDRSPQSTRADAAESMFDYLRKKSSRNNSPVMSIERVCDACLEWAKYPIKGNPAATKGKDIKVPRHLLITKLQDIPVPVVTIRLPPDPTKRYDNIVCIHRYDSTYCTAGGVNVPKILVCQGSDGRQYKQLFKGEGNDDLRQDAVMEQVFELVNMVLRRDHDTLKRDLHILTYKVVPLASQAGLIEFVEDTTRLGDWLPAAHKKYAPATQGRWQVWDKIGPGLNSLSKRSDDERVTAFKEVCDSWKPVMRHYFTERHKDPMLWFKLRLHYARSVATTSIVGHILGLGDRHLANILIHNESGEVVQIDLGIAFEQGKLLPLPERVPFRLTRDMVDGLGTSGTKGVFQRCAEETLRVLRDGSEVILTVLEVFKHDPLHSWTANELKLKQVQEVPSEAPVDDFKTEAVRMVTGLDMSASVVDEAADRALSSVVRKLDKGLSVQFTVNELIAEATDVVNLALLYYGWSAWC